MNRQRGGAANRTVARARRAAAAGAALALLATLLIACTPTTTGGTGATVGSLRPFSSPTLPREERAVIAVPDFSVRAGGIRIAGRPAEEYEAAEGFETELGRGVSDVFATEAFRSGRFIVTERDQLAAVLREQDLATSGRVDPATAAEAGRILGAEVLVLGSVTEFGVEQTGGGGVFFGVIGGRAETVTVRVSVDIRFVDAVTAEVLAIGVGTATASQSDVRIDLWNVVRALGAGRSGTTIIDVSVRNAIRAAIDEAAATFP